MAFCIQLTGKTIKKILNISFNFIILVGQKKLVCYHTNWSQYRPDSGKFFPENIDPFLCTHIIYAFAKLERDRLMPYEWNDDDSEWSKGMQIFVNAIGRISY